MKNPPFTLKFIDEFIILYWKCAVNQCVTDMETWKRQVVLSKLWCECYHEVAAAVNNRKGK